MKLSDIKIGDVLVNVDAQGAGYFQVLKVNRVTITVEGENGNIVKAYPNIFNRKVGYAVTFPEKEIGPMQYYFTAKSRNPKTGPMPVVTSSQKTCPDACPLKGAGCYAETGPMVSMWREVTAGTSKFAGTFTQLLAKVRALPMAAIWRYGQAGDLPGIGNAIDRDQLVELAKANGNRPVIAYTHKPPTAHNLAALREAEALGFHVNLSANNPRHADALAKHGLSVVTLLTEDYARRKGERIEAYRGRMRELTNYTPGGLRIAICPATYSKKVSCLTCQACSKRRPQGTVIGFPAHGSRKAQASTIATQ